MTEGDSDRLPVLSNPAKPLLYLVGAFGLFQGVFGVAVGLLVGPHILGSAIVLFAFGLTAVWLGNRHYDRVGRYGTITWASLALLLVLIATGLQPPTAQDVTAIIFIALLLMVIGTVLIVAVRNRSSRSAS